jgi:hypothetical protein
MAENLASVPKMLALALNEWFAPLVLGACEEDSKSKQQSSDVSAKNKDAELLREPSSTASELDRLIITSRAAERTFLGSQKSCASQFDCGEPADYLVLGLGAIHPGGVGGRFLGIAGAPGVGGRPVVSTWAWS